jgi:hypothetical protein
MNQSTDTELVVGRPILQKKDANRQKNLDASKTWQSWQSW